MHRRAAPSIESYYLGNSYKQSKAKFKFRYTKTQAFYEDGQGNEHILDKEILRE